MLYLLKEYDKKNERRLARELLLFGLKQEYGMDKLPKISVYENGKPYFLDYPKIYFNYSHCRYGILCGIHIEEIGVDMERILSYKESLARRICHPEELEWLANEEKKDEILTYIWTAKESYLKYTGKGIRCDLRLLNCTGGKKNVFEMNGTSIWRQQKERFTTSVCTSNMVQSIIEVKKEDLTSIY